MTSVGDSIPPWAMHHEPAFAALLRALERVPGFILQPLETPSRDVDRLLATWLTARGRPTHVVAPTTPDEWRGLTVALRSLPKNPGRIVLFSGPHAVEADVSHGLAMVNLHRDGIARELACPLLWCGSEAFLQSTWRRAPDFWSIGSVVKRMPAQPVELPVLYLDVQTESRDIDSNELFVLWAAAQQQGDRDNEASLCIRLIGALLAEGNPTFAATMEAELDHLLPFEIPSTEVLRLMRYRARLGRSAEELRADYQELLGRIGNVGSRSDEAQTLLQLGLVDQTSGKLPAARDGMRTAVEIFHELGDARSEAVAGLQLAQVDLDAGDVAEAKETLRAVESALLRAPDVELHTGLRLIHSKLLIHAEAFSEALDLLPTIDAADPEDFEPTHDTTRQSGLNAAAELLRGVALACLSKDSDAEKHLKRALEWYSQQDLLSVTAWIYRMLATLEKQALEHHPMFTSARIVKLASDRADAVFAQKELIRAAGHAFNAQAHHNSPLAALLAWDAYKLSTNGNQALFFYLHTSMLDLVRQALSAIPDDEACAAVDRLIEQHSRHDAVNFPGPNPEDRDIVDRAVTALRNKYARGPVETRSGEE